MQNIAWYVIIFHGMRKGRYLHAAAAAAAAPAAAALAAEPPAAAAAAAAPPAAAELAAPPPAAAGSKQQVVSKSRHKRVHPTNAILRNLYRTHSTLMKRPPSKY